jgi:uncharacterized protein (DUF1800 family)
MITEDIDPKVKKALIDKFRAVKPEPITTNSARVERTAPSARLGSVTSGLEAYTGDWDDKHVAHFLRRALFGFKKSDVGHFKSIGIDKSIDEVIRSSPKPPPPVNNYNGIESGVNDPAVNFGETWINAPYLQEYEGHRIISLKCWIIDNAINQESTIHEKLNLFWHSLLVTGSWDVFRAKASYQYFETLRANALGNYKVLIKALTIDPSMLMYLNGTENKKNAPNENYARELQELFCLGKGPNSNYTESDVQAAARVLTGWHIKWDSLTTTGAASSVFNLADHDTTDKQFSAFYDNKVIKGQPSSEVGELIDLLFSKEELSKYICRRIYSFFIYNEIDDTIEKNIIEPLATIFRESKYEILPVVKKLFASEHFFDDLNIGAMIKSPMDFAIGTWRALNVKNNTSDLLTNHRVSISLLWNMANMGLEICDPPNVAGWPAYYQAPQYDKAWITTNTVTARAQVTDALLSYGFWVTSDIKIKADFVSFVKTLDEPSIPASLVKEAALLLLGYEIPENTVTLLKSILFSGQQNEYYWTRAWEQYLINPSVENQNLIQSRLQYFFQRLLQLGESQLM